VNIAQKSDTQMQKTDSSVIRHIAIVGQRNFFVDGIISMLESDAWHNIALLENKISAQYDFREIRPDILFLHTGSIPPNPDEFIKQLIIVNPGIRILVFGQGMVDDYLYSVIQAGALGYLNEKMTGSHLTQAIDTVMHNDYWVERHIMTRLISGCSIRAAISHRVQILSQRLTRREAEVLEMVMQGLDTKEIADKICLSHHSIKAHLGNLFKKFSVKNRSQLILHTLNEACPAGNLTRLVQQGLQGKQGNAH
jgi:DNA-binding NarL/FixJ family response regulator